MKREINLRSTSDGWRGVIAESFTFYFVEKVAVAIAQYLSKLNAKEILIGYDTRFLSHKFAERAGEVFCHYGIRTLISAYPITTPMLSFRVNQLGLYCGIMITASHNPYWYNGIKLRMGYGGPPDKSFTEEIEKLMPLSLSLDLAKESNILEDNLVEDYIDKVRSLLNLDAFKSRTIKILVDTMHGATAGILQRILSDTNIKIYEINNSFDPYFGGIAPEPQPSNTLELQNLTLTRDFSLGIAHDGDGDRIVASAPELGYLSPHDIVAILLLYLIKVKKETGLIIGSVTLSKRIARLAEQFGLEYREVPIGFRNACRIMRNEQVLIAGEENGGIGFGFYLPERDGTVAAALLIEAELCYEGGVKKIMRDITEVAGTSGFSRLNLRVSKPPATVMRRLETDLPEKLMKQQVVRVNRIDGIKLFLKNGSWVNIRVAGTEELIRIYAESEDNEKALRLANSVEEVIRKIEKRR